MRSKVEGGRTSSTPTIWRNICDAGVRRSPAASQPYPRLASAKRTASTGGCCITPSRYAMNSATSFGGLARASTSKISSVREETIRNTERELRTILETIPAFVWTAGPDGALDFPTERWFQRMRHTREEVVDWKWTSMIHPDDRDRVVEKWREAITGGDPFDLEMRGRDAEGKYRWFLTRRRCTEKRNGRGHPMVWNAHGHRGPQARGARAARAEGAALQGEHRASRRDHPDVDVRGDRRDLGAAPAASWPWWRRWPPPIRPC